MASVVSSRSMVASSCLWLWWSASCCCNRKPRACRALCKRVFPVSAFFVGLHHVASDVAKDFPVEAGIVEADTTARPRPRAANRAYATASRAARANGSTADPTSISRTERPDRSSSCCPTRTPVGGPGRRFGKAGLSHNNHETPKPLQIYGVTCVYASLLLLIHQCIVSSSGENPTTSSPKLGRSLETAVDLLRPRSILTITLETIITCRTAQGLPGLAVPAEGNRALHR